MAMLVRRLLLALIAAALAAGAARGAESRDARMTALFQSLQTAPSEPEAEFIAEEIEAIWRDSGSATANLLIDRAEFALEAGEAKLARALADGALALAPDYADGWSRSAAIALEGEDVARAIADIEKALALEPRHYGALIGLGVIFTKLERWEAALHAFEQAKALYPLAPGLADRLGEAERKAKGRDL